MTPPARPDTSADLASLLTLLRRICETPAPTFAEEARGDLVAGLLRGAGLEPRTDRVGNVSAEVPGGSGPRVLVAAHLDTVFPADTDVTVREITKETDTRLAAPGIGDNSASLAVMLRYAPNPGRGNSRGRAAPADPGRHRRRGRSGRPARHS